MDAQGLWPLTEQAKGSDRTKSSVSARVALLFCA